MNYAINILFEDVPKKLIEQINSRNFTYDDYISMCPLYNSLPTYWNLALLEDDNIVGFVWGTIEPLEKFLHVVRITMLKRLRFDMVRMVFMDYMHKVEEKYGTIWTFFISDHADLFVGNSNGRMKISNGQVVEVLTNEDL